MLEPTTLKESQVNGALIIKIKGRLDAISSQETEKHLLDLIEKNHTRLLVLNFSELQYLSSAGLRVLLTLNKKLQGLSGRLALSSLAPQVLDILKMSGFDRLLTISSTDQDALQDDLCKASHNHALIAALKDRPNEPSPI